MLFQDRQDAGRKLAGIVAQLPDLADAVVLALPRGGVPVASEVARACHLPLDILTVRKLGAPGQPELALGAVASGGIVVLNPQFVSAFHLSEDELGAMIAAETEAIERREQLYRQGLPRLPIAGRTVILVDDGMATGASMRAAARAVRPRAARLILAVPVAAAATCRDLESEADTLLCLFSPPDFEAVGQFYRDFSPTSDEEVRARLASARTCRSHPPAAWAS